MTNAPFCHYFQQFCSVCFATLVHSMHRSGGNFSKGKKVCIGQGFRGKSSDHLGIGNCTKGFNSFVKGCPPKAADILAFFKDHTLACKNLK